MIVMKFGGTSVGTRETIMNACSIVKSWLDKGKSPFVVVSAHNAPTCRMTDTLIASANAALEGSPDATKVRELQLSILDQFGLPESLVEDLLDRYAKLLTGIDMIGEISPRTLDLVMSYGERMSCRVFAEVLQKEFDVNAKAITSMDLGLMTDGVYGSALPDETSYPKIKLNVENSGADVVITTGFMGKTPDGHIATLGRGGSDFSGTIFGAALHAEEVQIWTDVDGVMSADPRTAPAAKSIPELSFSEASELSWYGAKVLHPATMIPAVKHDIPVRVLNTKSPEHPGTLIVSDDQASAEGIAKSIAHHKHINMLTITSSRMLGMHGFMAKVFEICSNHDIDIHMIATSEVSISLTTPADANIEAAAEELRKYGDVKVEKEKAIVCVIGENMAGVPGVAAKVAGALSEAGINIRMISQGANEINIALLLDARDADRAVAALHSKLFE